MKSAGSRARPVTSTKVTKNGFKVESAPNLLDAS